MAISTALISVLLAAATLYSIVAISHSKPAGQGLRLQSYSEDEVKGCYEHNQTLGVCFDVKKGAMKIEKTTGEEIVNYQELGPDMFFYQVLDQAFVGSVPSMYYVPDYVPRDSEALRAFLKYIRSKDGMEQREALKTHFQEAMSELHNVPEVQLLELVSAALGDNSTRLEILKPFHALSFYLLKQADVNIPSDLRATPDVSDQHDREKRCTSLRSNRGNDCRGMCGRKCSCWSWVCGNCCFHQGCYEHDLCCDHDFWSTYCLTPFGFSCGRYKGYPRCINSFWPWK